MSNLKDNKDGSCNCRMIMPNTCFFTGPFGSRCDCKCHFAKKSEEWKDRLKSKLSGWIDAGEIDEGVWIQNAIEDFVAEERAILISDLIKKFEKVETGDKWGHGNCMEIVEFLKN
jgi:hypothetical protein